MLQIIIPLSLAMGLAGFGSIARLYLIPWLDRTGRDTALPILILPHVFRYIGLWFLVPGIVSPDLPAAFAVPAAYGDFIAATLAVLAIVAMRSRWGMAPAVVWIFGLFGTADLLNALLQGFFNIGHPGQLGAAYVIPVLFVPLLLVSHFLIFRCLLKPAGGDTQ